MEESPDSIILPALKKVDFSEGALEIAHSHDKPMIWGLLLGGAISMLPAIFVGLLSNLFFSILTILFISGIGVIVAMQYTQEFKFRLDLQTKDIDLELNGSNQHWNLDDSWNVTTEVKEYRMPTKLFPFGFAPHHSVRHTVAILASEKNNVSIFLNAGSPEEMIPFASGVENFLSSTT